MAALISRQFLLFSVGGVIGFLIDSGVLLTVLRFTGLGFYWGRVCSYVVAATFTWMFHRLVTFSATSRSRKLGQWMRFLVANAIGALINFGAYVLSVSNFGWMAQHAVAAVAIGSVSGLCFNYFASKTFVFRSALQPQGAASG